MGNKIDIQKNISQYCQNQNTINHECKALNYSDFNKIGERYLQINSENLEDDMLISMRECDKESFTHLSLWVNCNSGTIVHFDESDYHFENKNYKYMKEYENSDDLIWLVIKSKKLIELYTKLNILPQLKQGHNTYHFNFYDQKNL